MPLPPPSLLEQVTRALRRALTAEEAAKVARAAENGMNVAGWHYGDFTRALPKVFGEKEQAAFHIDLTPSAQQAEARAWLGDSRNPNNTTELVVARVPALSKMSDARVNALTPSTRKYLQSSGRTGAIYPNTSEIASKGARDFPAGGSDTDAHLRFETAIGDFVRDYNPKAEATLNPSIAVFDPADIRLWDAEHDPARVGEVGYRYAQGGTVKPTYNTQNPMDHGLRNAELAQRIARAKRTGSDMKKGALSWAPDVAGFFLGDIPDAAAYVLRRAKNVQGEQSIPSLGAGAAVRRAVHDLQSQLGLEDKFVPPTGQSVGPVYEPSGVEQATQFANPLTFVNPASVARGAGRGGAELIARAAQGEGPLARMATAGFRPMNVIKSKGGNWLTGSVESALSNVKRGAHFGPGPAEILPGSPTEAINSWVDKALTKYVKNQMATPEDPIRALAEQGVLHFTPDWVPEGGLSRGQAAGLTKGEQGRRLGKSQQAQDWEDLSDQIVNQGTAGDPDGMQKEYMASLPWLTKLQHDVPVYGLAGGADEALGFHHLIDELSNAINPESGLPRHLLFPADRLEKVSVPQAVQRVSDINKWRAEQKVLADQARANNAATVLHKEYPHSEAAPNPQGLRWVQLRRPEHPANLPAGWEVRGNNVISPEGIWYGTGDDLAVGMEQAKKAITHNALQDALKYEGDIMRHCVGRYCDDVASGRSQIFSLRDSKGEPHATIEVGPDVEDFERGVARRELLPEEFAKRYPTPLGTRIVQIKGKLNRAPNPEYLPFVQDFVKSGQWSDVGELYNAGLVRNRATGEYITAEEARRTKGFDPQELPEGPYGGNMEPEGFASGGGVNLAGGGSVLKFLRGATEKAFKAYPEAMDAFKAYQKGDSFGANHDEINKFLRYIDSGAIYRDQHAGGRPTLEELAQSRQSLGIPVMDDFFREAAPELPEDLKVYRAVSERKSDANAKHSDQFKGYVSTSTDPNILEALREYEIWKERLSGKGVWAPRTESYMVPAGTKVVAPDLFEDLEYQKEIILPRGGGVTREGVFKPPRGYSQNFASGGPVTVPNKIETVGQLKAIIASLSKDATHA